MCSGDMSHGVTPADPPATDFGNSFEVVINAPAHTVVEYCRDPRRIYAGDRKLEVSDVTLTPEGVGTTARVVTKGVVTEEVTIEYVEFVPNRNAHGQEEVAELFTARGKSFSNCTSYAFELQAYDVIGGMAYTAGLEHTSATVEGQPRTYTPRATQVYRREDGEWKVARRHGDTVTE